MIRLLDSDKAFVTLVDDDDEASLSKNKEIDMSTVNELLEQLQTTIANAMAGEGDTKAQDTFKAACDACVVQGGSRDTIGELVDSLNASPVNKDLIEAAIKKLAGEGVTSYAMNKLADSLAGLKKEVKKGAWGVGFSSSPFAQGTSNPGWAAPAEGAVVWTFTCGKQYADGGAYDLVSKESGSIAALQLLAKAVNAVLKAQSSGLQKSDLREGFSVTVSTSETLRKADGDEPLGAAVQRHAARPSSRRDTRATGPFAGR